MSDFSTPPRRSTVSRLRANGQNKRRRVDSTPDAPRVPPILPSSPSSSLSPVGVPHSPLPIFVDPSYLGSNFTSIGRLGQGAFGEVKAVRCKMTNERFAVKKFQVDPLKERSGLNYNKINLEEVKVHEMIPSHPNIVEFFQSWKEDKSLYILMELCDDSLEGFWKSQIRLGNEELRRALVDCLLGLHHLHSSNLIHLDIKPANILRMSNGLYKLADFSVTLKLDKKNLSSSDMGTGLYVAPEVLQRVFTTKADIYSLGLTMAEVSVSFNERFTGKEWKTMREVEKLPDRITDDSTNNLVSTIRSMINRDHSTRPSIEFLLSTIEPAQNNLNGTYSRENAFNRMTSKRGRLSLPSTKSDQKSIGIGNNENCDLIFDDAEGFFEFTRPSIGKRHSMAPVRLRFDD